MSNYEVIRVIDEGAYGIVSQAVNKETGQIVAIKEFKEDYDDPVVKAALEREIRMLRESRSPFVVELLEAYKKENNKIYFVFEFLPSNLLNLIDKYE
jgi:serine/threonine protein kinase